VPPGRVLSRSFGSQHPPRMHASQTLAGFAETILHLFQPIHRLIAHIVKIDTKSPNFGKK
jgi:hypothetical protein